VRLVEPHAWDGQHGVVRVVILPGQDQHEPPASDPGTLSEYRDRAGQSLLFTTTGSEDGIIWGNGIDTDDSTLAVAAVHAGVLKVGERGVVKVTILPGQDSYDGSTQNGITSRPYGSFPGSYRVESRDASGALLGWTLPKPPAPPGEVNLSEFRGQPGKTIVLQITGATGGAVWGTDVYTDDSSIPAAAVHAGVLKDGETGIVQITMLPGQESYAGSNRNRVESGSWGHWDGSFRIERHGVTTGAIREGLDHPPSRELKYEDLGAGEKATEAPPVGKSDVRSY
jgi:hypothetical protein